MARLAEWLESGRESAAEDAAVHMHGQSST